MSSSEIRNKVLFPNSVSVNRHGSSHRLVSAQKIPSKGMEEEPSGEHIICNIEGNEFNEIKDNKIDKIIEKITKMKLNESTPEIKFKAFNGRKLQVQKFLLQF